MDSYTELLRLNQLRVLTGEGHPKVLVGGINLNSCPNSKTFPMIEMGASIVGITIDPVQRQLPEMLYVNPNASITRAIKTLPSKWKPDFFWDSQVEHGHYLPPGVGDLSIPTIASFVHAHLGQSLYHLQGMFDVLIAPNAEMAKWGDVVLPWGASWGEFDDYIETITGPLVDGARDVDLSVTFGPGKLGAESVRPLALKAAEEFKQRHPELAVEIKTGLKSEEYYRLLRRSKVSLNVGTWGQQVTYRAMEIIACGACLAHIDETAYGSRSSITEFLDEAVVLRPTTLDAIAVLAKSGAWKSKARSQKRQVAEHFTYERQYRRMFELALGATPKKRLSVQDWSRRAFAVNVTTGFSDYGSVHAWAVTDGDRASARRPPEFGERDVILWTPKDAERTAVWRTDISRREQPVGDIYRKHYEEENRGHEL